MKKITILVLFLLHQHLYSQTIEIIANEVCFGNLTTLQLSTNIADNQIKSILWDFDNDGLFDNGSGKNISFTFPFAGNLPINVLLTTISGSEYNLPTSKLIIVNPLPVVSFEWKKPCEMDITEFRNSSIIDKGQINQLLWDLNDDGVFEKQGETATRTYSKSGIFIGKLKAITDKGCIASNVQNIVIYSKPEADFSVIGNCLNDSILFKSNSIILNDEITDYIWKLEPQALLVSNINARHKYSRPGNYSIDHIVMTSNGCLDTVNRQIVVNAAPEITFTFDNDTILFAGNVLQINSNNDFVSYLWSNESTQSSIIVDKSGLYSLIATDNKGCKAEKSVNVLVKDIPELKIKNNVLTPNGDGINDYFKIANIEEYPACEVTIFNSTGNILFNSKNYKNDWDGNYNGKLLNAGSYFYYIKIKETEIKGTISVLR